MSPERRTLALSLVTVGVIVLPIVNIIQNPYLLEVIKGKIDCGEDTKALDPNHRFDAIVVPGAGIIRTAGGEVMPNPDQRIRLKAAAAAFLGRLAPRIVLLDGAGESNWVTSAYLQTAFSELTGGLETIPDADISTEDDQSINTATNMKELAKIATAHNLRKVVIVTNQYHLRRSVMFACINGVAASPLSAEELLANAGNIRTPWAIIKTETKELIEVAFLFLDPDGRLPTELRRIAMKK